MRFSLDSHRFPLSWRNHHTLTVGSRIVRLKVAALSSRQLAPIPTSDHRHEPGDGRDERRQGGQRFGNGKRQGGDLRLGRAVGARHGPKGPFAKYIIALCGAALA